MSDERHADRPISKEVGRLMDLVADDYGLATTFAFNGKPASFFQKMTGAEVRDWIVAFENP